MWLITGSPKWESVPVSPWPGKCLADELTRWSCRPRTAAVTFDATSWGREENDRTPITGLAGLTLTSLSGA